LPESRRQTLDSKIPSSLPLEIAFTRQILKDESSKAIAELYRELVVELVARSSRGKLFELGSVDHSQLLHPGPVLDRLVGGIKQLTLAAERLWVHPLHQLRIAA
jgi:hypothetical protein